MRLISVAYPVLNSAIGVVATWRLHYLPEAGLTATIRIITRRVGPKAAPCQTIIFSSL